MSLHTHTHKHRCACASIEDAQAKTNEVGDKLRVHPGRTGGQGFGLTAALARLFPLHTLSGQGTLEALWPWLWVSPLKSGSSLNVGKVAPFAGVQLTNSRFGM